MPAGRLAEVFWTARYDYQPRAILKRHRHDYFQLIYIVSGEGEFQLGSTVHPIIPGVLFLIKPRKFHGLRASSLVKTLDLKFEVRDARLHRQLMEAREVMTESMNGIAHLFDQIRYEGEMKAALHRQVCDALLVQILAYVIRSGATSMSAAAVEPEVGGSEQVRRLLSFIRGHYAQKLTLTDMSTAIGRSDRLVRDLMHRTVGMSPMRYSLKEITEMSGFRTLHHFTRVFHLVTSETPAAWRRKNRQGICMVVYIDPNFSNVLLTVDEGQPK